MARLSLSPTMPVSLLVADLIPCLARRRRAQPLTRVIISHPRIRRPSPGGSVFLQPLEADGSFSSAPGNLIKFPFEPTTTPLRNENRQEASHPHEVVEVAIEGGKTEIWVPDLGQDKIWRLELEEKAGVASWKLKEGTHVAGDDGGGPRHIVVGDKGASMLLPF
jgi:hypothetical protein